MEEETPLEIHPVSPEQVSPEQVATPVVHVAQPVSDHTSEKLAHLEDTYAQMTLKLGEISGKLDAMVHKSPEPIAPSVVENEANDSEKVASELHKEGVPDAVTLTVDDKPIKAPKEQPQERNRRGLRKRR